MANAFKLLYFKNLPEETRRKIVTGLNDKGSEHAPLLREDAESSPLWLAAFFIIEMAVLIRTLFDDSRLDGGAHGPLFIILYVLLFFAISYTTLDALRRLMRKLLGLPGPGRYLFHSHLIDTRRDPMTVISILDLTDVKMVSTVTRDKQSKKHIGTKSEWHFTVAGTNLKFILPTSAQLRDAERFDQIREMFQNRSPEAARLDLFADVAQSGGSPDDTAKVVGSKAMPIFFRYVLVPALALGMVLGPAVWHLRNMIKVGDGPLETSSFDIDPNKEGKIVRVAGHLKCAATVKDKKFNVELDAARLKRNTEIFQWKEIKKVRKKGKVTYSYEKGWSPKPIKNSKFKKPKGHKNKSRNFIKSRAFDSKGVKLGHFRLSKDFFDLMSTPYWFRFRTTGDEFAQVRKKFPKASVKTEDGLPDDEYRYIYLSGRHDKPKIGDVRVSFSHTSKCSQDHYMDANSVEVIAMQKKDSLVSFGDEEAQGCENDMGLACKPNLR